ncbi:MAG TPA: biopolymer transporter ExbD [Gemmatimonadaceae bacterium]|nr:biopolymer transporter ExbD [Gemmatimonadaceae bacterium]
MRASTEPVVRAEPNVTPMIDVMLVLLIIFMVVTPALLNGFPAVPPEASNPTSHPETRKDHILGIDTQGRYYLDKRPISAAQLTERLRLLFAQADNRVLFLQADKDLEYAQVQEALSRAAESGVRVVGMIAEPRRESSARLP